MVNANTPRPDYPRPQFSRPTWLCLNGQWQFEIDPTDTGLELNILDRPLNQTITVPFCPESKLSTIEHTDFMPAVWYRRDMKIPAQWHDKRILLHFQAVDYDATVWCNGQLITRHRGGFTPFTADITNATTPGQNATIVLRARDDHQSPKPRGKQSQKLENQGCLYTRTTGIWQTVWLEPVPKTYLDRPRITPDLTNSCFHIQQPIIGNQQNLALRITLSDKDGIVTLITHQTNQDFSPTLIIPIPEDRITLWSPDNPHLYDIAIELLDSDKNPIDTAQSYAGLRSVTIDQKAVKINGQTIFQRLVLDQGYYPDSIMTAPSDDAIIQDIELSLAAGFNGARLHQKVFEERFLYHADRLGYLVWGEFADWGCKTNASKDDWQKPSATYITQWLEILNRDYNHPAIVGWCPLNETIQNLTDHITDLDDVALAMFLATKAFDTTRPVLDTSGYAHRVPLTDVYDSHDYTQDPETFAQRHADTIKNKPFINTGRNNETWNLPYTGQPFFISEFGGIRWNPSQAETKESWGYGQQPKSIEEFYDRFQKLCEVLLNDPSMFGYCYTQLTDVFQEQNGIYNFDRSTKFDMQKIKQIQQQPAAIENI